MSRVGAIVLAALALAAVPARADAPAPVSSTALPVVDANPDEPMPPAAAPPPRIVIVRPVMAPPPRKSYVGLTLDLGMPDIVGLAVAVRPVWWLRLQAGGTTDLFSGGIAGAVSFVPLDGLLSPSVTLAGGHVFASESLGIPRIVGINADGQRIGYDFGTLHAGLEIGAQRRINVSIQGGASFVNLTSVPDGSRPSNFSTATLHVWTPSGRVALTVFL